jgi:hypothetical protein
MSIRFALAMMLLSCAGCFQVDMYAPHGMNVYLISSDAPVKVRRTWRTWYVIWGVAHVDDTMPDTIIAREKLTEVRVVTIDTVPDAFIGLLYNVLIPIGLANQSYIVEGNRAANDPATEAMPSGP